MKRILLGLFIQYGVLQHSCSRAYFAQDCRQMRVLSCCLKVVLALHINEHISLYAKSSLNA